MITSRCGRYVQDPRIAWGLVCIARRWVPCESVAERVRHGDTFAEAAEDFGLTLADVLDAVVWDRLERAWAR